MKTNRHRSSLESLESRIAPAAILTFTDVDGDIVKVTSNKAIAATVSFTATGNPAEINVTGPGLDGASLAFTVTKSAMGDGLVNLGRIVATGLDLGAVSVPGDLGKIVCGNANNPLPGLKSLTAKSIGNYNTATQGGGDLNSVVTGDLGALNVAGSVLGVSLQVTGKASAITIGGDFRGDANYASARLLANGLGTVKIGGDVVAGTADESGKIVCFGDLGRLQIGGSLLGALDAVADSTAQIAVSGQAGPITIGHDISGAISEQRALEVTGDAGAITIGGSLLGHAGKYSASVYVGGNAGAIKIGGNVEAGSGDFSGRVAVAGHVAGFTLGHDLRGGSGSELVAFSIQQVVFGSATGPVKIGGDIVGGTGPGSGSLEVTNGAPSFTLGGSIIGGGALVPGLTGVPGGSVSLGYTAAVSIGGDLVGSIYNGGNLSALVGKLTIKGSLIGSSTIDSQTSVLPLLDVIGGTASVTIGGSVVGAGGGDGTADSTIHISGNVGAFSVHGSLTGGPALLSGALIIDGKAGAVSIGGSLNAGAGGQSGSLRIMDRVTSLKIGGSVHTDVFAPSFGRVTLGGDLFGNVEALAGGFDSIAVGGSLLSANFGGTLKAVKSLGNVTIKGSVLGSNGNGDANLRAQSAGQIAIGGDVVGVSALSPIFQFGGGVGAVTIGGDLRGPASAVTRLIFNTESPSGRGFASLLVKGNVEHAFIGSGLDPFNFSTKQPDSTVGAVTVGGNWIASSLVAGIGRGMDNLTGTADDKAQPVSTLSRIAAITIAGQVLGTQTAGDHFGFVAHSIGKVKIGGQSYTPGAAPIELSPVTADMTIRTV